MVTRRGGAKERRERASWLGTQRTRYIVTPLARIPTWRVAAAPSTIGIDPAIPISHFTPTSPFDVRRGATIFVTGYFRLLFRRLRYAYRAHKKRSSSSSWFCTRAYGTVGTSQRLGDCIIFFLLPAFAIFCCWLLQFRRQIRPSFAKIFEAAIVERVTTYNSYTRVCCDRND